MRLLLATHRRTAYGEDAEALVRAIIAMTAAVGAFAAVGSAASGQLPLIGVPTLVLLGSVLVGAPIAAAASSAGVIWLMLLPMASGEALLVPLTMVMLCVAIAAGPERLLSWLASDAAPERAADLAEVGWIEEDDGRIV